MVVRNAFKVRASNFLQIHSCTVAYPYTNPRFDIPINFAKVQSICEYIPTQHRLGNGSNRILHLKNAKSMPLAWPWGDVFEVFEGDLLSCSLEYHFDVLKPHQTLSTCNWSENAFYRFAYIEDSENASQVMIHRTHITKVQDYLLFYDWFKIMVQNILIFKKMLPT